MSERSIRCNVKAGVTLDTTFKVCTFLDIIISINYLHTTIYDKIQYGCYNYMYKMIQQNKTKTI